MKTALFAALIAVTATTPMTIPTADAQSRERYRDRDRNGDYRWRDDDNWNPRDSYREGRYRERRLGRNDSIYRGDDGRAYCRRNDGTTGLVVGGLAGGVLGNVVGGGTLGTLLGAGGGALLGRSVDRGKVRCR